MKPDYVTIPPALPLARPWDAFDEHIGPVEHVTPLGKAIAGKTYCGLLLLSAGILNWGAVRLEGYCDTGDLRDLAEAMVAMQADWRVLNADALAYQPVPDTPWYLSLKIGLEQQVRDIANAEVFWSGYTKPDGMVFYIAHALGYTLPEAELARFHGWLRSVCARLDAVARRPQVERFSRFDFDNAEELEARAAPLRGTPLPPQALDPEAAFDPAEAGALFEAWRATLDIGANPYLRAAQGGSHGD